jgi:3'-5' exonuclease
MPQKTDPYGVQNEQRALHFEQASLWDIPTNTPSRVVTQPFVTPRYELITEPAQLEAMLPRLLDAPVVAVDTETTGLDPLSDHLRLVQLSSAGSRPSLFPTSRTRIPQRGV